MPAIPIPWAMPAPLSCIPTARWRAPTTRAPTAAPRECDVAVARGESLPVFGEGQGGVCFTARPAPEEAPPRPSPKTGREKNSRRHLSLPVFGEGQGGVFIPAR